MRSRTSAIALLFGVGVGSVVLGACGSSDGNSQFDPNDPKNNLFGNGDGGGFGDGGIGDFRDANDVLEAGCATATSSATRTPVYMLVVLDGSGSMDSDNK